MNKAHIFIAESHETRADIMFFPRCIMCMKKNLRILLILFYIDTKSRSKN